jgi:hypothetical protein
MIARPTAVLALAGVMFGCAPRLQPLGGAAAPVALPDARLPAGAERVVFNWRLDDQQLSARGDGVARVTAPDSARLDFFLGGGLGSGAGVLIADTLDAPGPALVRRLIPPPPLMWAALGRLAVPALADTVVHLAGDTLRADIGQPVAWRASFLAGALRRLERVDGGRVQEWVERTDSTHVHYRNETGRRSLDIVITRSEPVAGFDPAIWHLPE